MRTGDEHHKPFVEEAAKNLRCNCDLDNWQPEPETGHSWVCRIHKAAIEAKSREVQQ